MVVEGSRYLKPYALKGEGRRLAAEPRVLWAFLAVEFRV